MRKPGGRLPMKKKFRKYAKRSGAVVCSLPFDIEYRVENDEHRSMKSYEVD
jgi:hypothetical protein